MSTAALSRITPEEYLALERHAEFKSEFIDGRIVAMSPGASRPHILIVSDLMRELGVHLLGTPCEVYANDLRVKAAASGDYVYPDIVVSCEPEFEDENFDNLLTPMLIIEVLSDSTERQDRSTKWGVYRRIETLREYVLISQKEPRVERYVRQADLWQFSVAEGMDAALVLSSISLELPLERIFGRAMIPTRKVPRKPSLGE